MQLDLKNLKLYDYIILDLEWAMRELLGVISFASYIQEWRQSIWETNFFQEFKTRDGIRRSKSWEQQNEAKEALKRMLYMYMF
jgi:uncharacterized protein YktA (UPF0223 family)